MPEIGLATKIQPLRGLITSSWGGVAPEPCGVTATPSIAREGLITVPSASFSAGSFS